MPKTHYECPRCEKRKLVEVGTFVGLPDADKHHFRCGYKGCYYRAVLDDEEALNAVVHGFPISGRGRRQATTDLRNAIQKRAAEMAPVPKLSPAARKWLVGLLDGPAIMTYGPYSQLLAAGYVETDFNLLHPQGVKLTETGRAAAQAIT